LRREKVQEIQEASVTMGSVAPQREQRDERDEQAETPLSRLATLAREQMGQVALLLMAVVGLGIAIYLTIVHYDSKVSLLCTTGGVVSCQSVTTSAYSVVPGTGIPVTIPGLLWFLALGGLAGVGLWAAARGQAEPPRLRSAALLWTIAGLAFVIYLVFCEIVLVQRICEWCTVVHLLTLAAFLITLTRWQRRDEPAMPAPRVASARQASARQASAPTATAARPAATALSRRTRRALNRRPPTAR
jgi:uncharacterized membrane protein